MLSFQVGGDLLKPRDPEATNRHMDLVLESVGFSGTPNNGTPYPY